MKRQGSIRVIDPATGEATWYKLYTENHTLKLERRKQFSMHCGGCMNIHTRTYETHIQHGLFDDRYHEWVYCDKCESITVHIYDVAHETA